MIAPNNSLIVKNSVILFARLVITALSGLFTARFLLQGLGPSDYGLYNVVGGIVILMAFLNGTLITMSSRFIAYEMGRGNLDGLNKIFNISLAISIILTFIIALLAETVGIFYIKYYLNVSQSNLGDAYYVLHFSTISIIILIISIPYQAVLTASENFSVRAIIESTRSLLGLILAFFIFKYNDGNSLRFYVKAFVVVNLIPAFLFFLYCKFKYLGITKIKIQKDWSKYKEMLGFSSWVTIGGVASIGMNQGSSLIINLFFGTLLNASFGLANQVFQMINMFAKNISQAAIPQIIKSYSSGDTNRSISIVSYLTKYTYFLMIVPSLPILLKTQFIIKLWLVEMPPYIISFIQLIIIYSLIESLTSSIPAVVQATGKIKVFQIFSSTISLLSLPLGYFLFSINLPPTSIIIAYIFTASINTIVKFVLFKKVILFDVKYFLKNSYLRILIVTIFLSPLFLFKYFFSDSILQFFILALGAFIWLTILIYFFGIDQKEKKIIKNIVRRKRIRIN